MSHHGEVSGVELCLPGYRSECLLSRVLSQTQKPPALQKRQLQPQSQCFSDIQTRPQQGDCCDMKITKYSDLSFPPTYHVIEMLIFTALSAQSLVWSYQVQDHLKPAQGTPRGEVSSENKMISGSFKRHHILWT